jgi:hypothetical protein
MLRMQERTFPGFKFQKFSGGVLPQTSPLPFMRGILVTHVAFSNCYPPSNILSHRKVPFQKMPPHGKILKKGPDIYVYIYVYMYIYFLKHEQLI